MNRPSQPDWLYNMSVGIDRGWTYTVVLEGPRFAVVKLPGHRYMSGQEQNYGSVSYTLVDKTDPAMSGTAIVRRGIELKDGGRINKEIKRFWTRLVNLPDRESIQNAINETTANARHEVD